MTPTAWLSSPTTRARLRGAAGIALVFLTWRGLLALLVLLGGAMTRERPDRDRNTYAWQAFPGSYFWDSWARWDSGWFQVVYREGYAKGPDATKKAAFFPLYPYTIRAVNTVVGNHWAAGLIVSNLALLGSLFFLERIAATGLDADGVRRAVVYLLCFPTSFFLSAYFSEGLFLLLSTAAFHFYLRERYVASGLSGALACLTRHVGLAVFVACVIGLVWGLHRGTRKFRPAALGLLLMPLGTLVFMAILYVQMGDPLAFLSAHRAWGRSVLGSGAHEFWFADLRHLHWSLPRDMMNTITVMDAVSAVVFLILPLFLFGRFDVALPIYSLLLILIPLSTGSLKSMMRCECVAFPVFLVLARFGRSRDVDRALVFGSALFLGLLALQFANWYWVG